MSEQIDEYFRNLADHDDETELSFNQNKIWKKIDKRIPNKQIIIFWLPVKKFTASVFILLSLSAAFFWLNKNEAPKAISQIENTKKSESKKEKLAVFSVKLTKSNYKKLASISKKFVEEKARLRFKIDTLQQKSYQLEQIKLITKTEINALKTDSFIPKTKRLRIVHLADIPESNFHIKKENNKIFTFKFSPLTGDGVEERGFKIELNKPKKTIY